ncbi:MAG: hypothetical protein NC253_15030, partial [Ruminococcus sp.]|nr:hypothetical protein [Ruminococcus sp.]MCM1382082.1 hypothetical protein [Muribaculaceae bacterium]
CISHTSYYTIFFLCGQVLKNSDTDDFLKLYKLACLYVHRLFDYSDMIDRKPDFKFTGAENLLIRFFIFDIGHHIGYLENAMRFYKIEFKEIRA